MDGDPSSAQAWLIAIPSAITAFSTWYMSKKTSSSATATQESAKKVVTDRSDETQRDLKDLKVRVATLEQSVGEARNTQLLIAMKHTESMDKLHAKMGETNVALQRVISQNVPVQTVKEPLVEPDKKDEETKIANQFGKIIVKP